MHFVDAVPISGLLILICILPLTVRGILKSRITTEENTPRTNGNVKDEIKLGSEQVLSIKNNLKEYADNKDVIVVCPKSIASPLPCEICLCTSKGELIWCSKDRKCPDVKTFGAKREENKNKKLLAKMQRVLKDIKAAANDLLDMVEKELTKPALADRCK